MNKEQEAQVFHEYFGTGAAKEWANNVPDEAHAMFLRMVFPIPQELASTLVPISRNLFERAWNYHLESNELYYRNPRCGRDPHTYSWIVEPRGRMDLHMAKIVMDGRTSNEDTILEDIKSSFDKLVSDDPCL